MSQTSESLCIFCFVDGPVSSLSKEHVLSGPVANAFGVERKGTFARYGLGDSPDDMVLVELDKLSVRAPCKRCNNTWMNDLESRMATLSVWMSSKRGLSAQEVSTVQGWSLKTYMVLSVLEGNTRRFIEEPQAQGVIPSATRARLLYQEDPSAFEGMDFGLARPNDSSRFAYTFGNPRVVPDGPRHLSLKSAGVAIVSLGAIQLWIVDTFMPGARTRFPPHVVRLRPDLRFKRLRRGSTVPQPDEVIVDNGEHDISELNGYLSAWIGANRPEA